MNSHGSKGALGYSINFRRRSMTFWSLMKAGRQIPMRRDCERKRSFISSNVYRISIVCQTSLLLAPWAWHSCS